MTLVFGGIAVAYAVWLALYVRQARKRQRDHEAVLRALKNLDRDIDKARNRILVMRGVKQPPPKPAT